jgi:uncharacterized protein YegP (UPF0339 family)
MSSILPKFQIFLGTDGQFYFRLLAAGNHEIILSSEGYKTKSGCQNGIASVKTNAPYDSRYVRKETSTVLGTRYFFILTATNNEPIGKSEMYNSISGRETGIESVKRNAPVASVEDLVPHLSTAR